MLEEQPIVGFNPSRTSSRITELVLFVVLLDQIQKNTPRLPNIGLPISQCRYSTIGVDLKKPRLFLLQFLECDRPHFVWESCLLLVSQILGMLPSYPSSSRVIDTLIPFGVPTVYRVISGEDMMRRIAHRSIWLVERYKVLSTVFFCNHLLQGKHRIGRWD